MSDLHQAVDRVRTAARSAGARGDDDVGRLIEALNGLILEIDAKADEVARRPAVDVERAIRKGLSLATPEFTSLWRSQARSWAAMALAVVVAVVGSGGAIAGYHIGRSVDAAYRAQMDSWCSNREHVTVRQQKGFCEIPVTIQPGS